MNKLVFAGVARLRRDIGFWVCFLVMTALGIYLPVGQYLDSIRFQFVFTKDGIIFNYAPFVCFAAAVFVSLYVGTDYSDGTIRNKMMVGRTRNEIYMADWVVCGLGTLLLCLAFAVPCTALCLLLPGVVEAPPMAFVTAALLSVLVALTISSVYTMCSMLCQNKAATAVICLCIAIILFMAAMMINSALSEPPTFQNYMMMVDGEMVLGDEAPNPRYLTGTIRAVYEFLNDFLPVNQGIQCAQLEAANPLRVALCDLGIILASTLAGLGLFARKDLK